MSKAYDNAKELEYIEFDSSNNKLNFTVDISSNNTVIGGADDFARIQANTAFIQANAAFESANNVDLTPAFNQANAAFEAANNAVDTWVRDQANLAFDKANSAVQYGANTAVTSSIVLPSGTSAERPANAANGAMRYNTTTRSIEGYLPSAGWTDIVQDQYTVQYIIVAGGGGGAARIGAGGGAGGVLTGNTNVTPLTTYTITVGAAGTAGQPGPYQIPSSTQGGNGTNSIAFTQIAFGGGGGGGTDRGNGLSGGSGGGGGRPAPATSGGSGVVGQGYPGGIGAGPADRSGGGGGAGAPGASGGDSGNGGNGIINPIFGSTSGENVGGTYYLAGGGGGAGYAGPTPGIGGYGGGGRAGPSTVGTPGTTNTGGGGGGGVYDGNAGYTGGGGGSGIVILSYISPTQRGNGGSVSSVPAGISKQWIHTFTGSGNFIA